MPTPLFLSRTFHRVLAQSRTIIYDINFILVYFGPLSARCRVAVVGLAEKAGPSTVPFGPYLGFLRTLDVEIKIGWVWRGIRIDR